MDSDIAARPTVHALLHRSAARFGDHDWMVSLDDRLTYLEAERQSAVLARRMLARGVGKGTRVGLFFTYGRDWLVAWLAAARIGALTVPLSTFYTPAELAKTLRLADIDVLLAPPAVLRIDVADLLERALPGLAGQSDALRLTAAPYLRRIWFTGPAGRSWATELDLYAAADDDGVGPDLLAAVEAEVAPADPVVMVYTSGSTADPKGVVHTHGTVVRQTAMFAPAIRGMSGDHTPRFLCAMPFFWIGGILAVAGSLHEPLTMLTLPRLDPGPALELMERERGTAIAGWPTLTQRMRAHPDFAGRDLSSAPMLVSGPADLSMAAAAGGTPTHRGMSETAGSFLHTDVAVVDPETGKPVPPGEEGELWIRGAGAMLGYNKRERSEVFDADGWYHTGDRVFVRPGAPQIYFAGRFTELIKSGGANVSPKEVEAVIEEFDEVLHCFVVGVEDALRGEQVTAVVVLAGPGADVDAVARKARAALSAYKVPARWIVTESSRLPVLTTGKPDKRRLQHMIVTGELR